MSKFASDVPEAHNWTTWGWASLPYITWIMI